MIWTVFLKYTLSCLLKSKRKRERLLFHIITGDIVSLSIWTWVSPRIHKFVLTVCVVMVKMLYRCKFRGLGDQFWIE